MDARRIVAGDDVDVVTVAAEEAPYRLVALTTEDGRAGDLVSVQVEDGQHRTIPRRVEEVDALPRALEWPRFGLAISDHGDREEVRVVEDGPEGVHEDVAELAALVDGAGRRHAHVARHAARRRELAEEPLQAVGVPCDRGVDLAVGALEVRVREESRAPVAWTGQVDDVRVDLSDQAVQMDVDQAETGRRAPVPEEPGLHVLGPERLAEERVLPEIYLPDGEVVRGTPVGVEGEESVVGHGNLPQCRAPARARVSRAAATTRSGVNPNFVWSAFSGADAPNVIQPHNSNIEGLCQGVA